MEIMFLSRCVRMAELSKALLSKQVCDVIDMGSYPIRCKSKSLGLSTCAKKANWSGVSRLALHLGKVGGTLSKWTGSMGKLKGPPS